MTRRDPNDGWVSEYRHCSAGAIIDLWFTSRVFAPGHRRRVSVSLALFPKYDRNLNTGGNNERDSTFVVARQRLLHDVAHPSHVVLPVVPR